MKKTIKTLTAASVLAAATLTSGVTMAEWTGNVGVTSNYLWRGVTQTSDSAAVSGGIDYSHENGIYAGLWTSNVDYTAFSGTADAETDLYLGFAGAAGDFGYDVGYINYRYNDTGASPTADFSEFYIGGSYKVFSLKYSMSNDFLEPDQDTSYIEAGFDFPVNDMTIGLHFGSYEFDDNPAADYTDYNISLSKDDFSIMYSDTDENLVIGQSDNGRISVSWSMGIEL